MSLSRRRFITIAVASGLPIKPGWASSEDGARWRGVALGAEADLRIVGIPRVHAQELISIARAEIERLEKQFSLYRQDSALVSLNDSGLLRHPSPDMLELLSLAKSVHAASGGAFDPTIQSLWKVYAEHHGKPSGELIESALAKTGWDKVEVSPSLVRLPDGGELTLNGIAQGFITDKVVALLKSHGLEQALVNVGEISAIGSPSGLDAWPVQLDGPKGARQTIRLRDRAVATSSAVGTTLDVGGAVSHILDPRDGLPATSLWNRVSIEHRSAAIADGLSTAGVLMTQDTMNSLSRNFDDVTVDAV